MMAGKQIKILLQSMLLVALATSWVSPALAKHHMQLTREQAIAIVKKKHPGKALKVREQEGPKGSFYQVKMLTPDGRVKLFRVNRENGELR